LSTQSNNFSHEMKESESIPHLFKKFAQKRKAIKSKEEPEKKKPREEPLPQQEFDDEQEREQKDVTTVSVEEKNRKLFSEVEGIPEDVRKAVKNAFNFVRMTEIQEQAIPAAMNNPDTDIIAQARTGSGKTLAFLIPCISYLVKEKFGLKKLGIGALILAPTRELAIQIQTVADKIMEDSNLKKNHKLGVGVYIGGNNKHQEALELKKGEINLMIATPGRCLDHLQDANPNVKNLKYFVMDEADMLIDVGYEKDVRAISEKLPKSKTSMLFSATLSNKVEGLAVFSLRPNPIYIGLETSTKVDSLIQTYMEIPSVEFKFPYLISLLRANKNKKIILFVAVKKAVVVMADILNFLKFVNIRALQGNMTQQKRTQTFFDFTNDKNPGILVATDVAARGLDFPNVDLIVQCDLPEMIANYFHRVGRTARGGKSGTAVLLLTTMEKMIMLDKMNKHLQDKYKEKTAKLMDTLVPDSADKIEEIREELRAMVAKHDNLQYDISLLVHIYNKYWDLWSSKWGLTKEQFDGEGLAKGFGLDSLLPPNKVGAKNSNANNFRGNRVRKNCSDSGKYVRSEKHNSFPARKDFKSSDRDQSLSGAFSVRGKPASGQSFTGINQSFVERSQDRNRVFAKGGSGVKK
jgi:ATP-dependent RNA helicase DDX18/HAS1